MSEWDSTPAEPKVEFQILRFGRWVWPTSARLEPSAPIVELWALSLLRAAAWRFELRALVPASGPVLCVSGSGFWTHPVMPGRTILQNAPERTD